MERSPQPLSVVPMSASTAAAAFRLSRSNSRSTEPFAYEGLEGPVQILWPERLMAEPLSTPTATSSIQQRFQLRRRQLSGGCDSDL